MINTSQTAPTSTLNSRVGEVSYAVTSAASFITNTSVITSSSNQNHRQNSGNNVNNSSPSNNRTTESGKRKKLKSRNTTVPNGSYSKNHLDAWLETCLKDASTAQLSSSSEFLDYNPSSFQSNKKASPQQQQQQQHMKPHQLPNIHQPTLSSSHHHHPQQHLPNRHKDNLQQFAMRLPSQSIGFGNQSTPFSQGFQKSPPMYMRNTYSNRFPSTHSTSNTAAFQCNGGATEFASLPPIFNVLNSENDNSTDVLDGSSNPNMSRGFRFSDPCLLNPSDNDSKISGQNTPDRRNNGEMENNKFFAALMEQISLLHETNSKICRNLHETKVDIEALKHAPNWGLRHRRDSLSGLSTQSQPLGFGFESPAPTYHSGAYTPGMMTDVVREVKEAARVREDALLSRVKAMVEERSWSMGESNVRTMRDIEELKAQVYQLRVDRKEANKRISHLEAENKYMRQMLGTMFRNRSQDIIYENEAMQRSMISHRKNYQAHDSCPATRHKPKRSNSLNLHYGTVLHQAMSGEESGEQMNELYIMESTSNLAAAAAVTAAEIEPTATSTVRTTTAKTKMGNSFSSSDDGGGGSGAGVQSVLSNSSPITNGSIATTPPTFALVTTTAKDDIKRNEQCKEIETQELQRELQEAVAARNKADSRIIALEKMVKNLQVKSSPTFNNGDERNINMIGVGNSGGSICGDGNRSISTASSSLVLHAPKTMSALQKFANSHSPHGSKTTELSKSQNNSQKLSSTSSLSSASAPELAITSQSFNNTNQQTQRQQQQQQQMPPPKMSIAGPITNL